MSLVNDMLNDLEARRASAPQSSVEKNYLSEKTRSLKSTSKSVKLALCCSLIVVASAVFAWFYQTNNHSATLPKESKANSESNKPQENKKWLSDLRFSKTSDSTVLHLNVGEKTAYTIHRTTQGLTIKLGDVTPNLEDKTIEPVFPIDTFSIDEHNDTTEVALTIKGDFHHKVSRQIGDEASITLTITPITEEKTNQKEKHQHIANKTPKAPKPSTTLMTKKNKAVKKVYTLSPTQKDKHISRQAAALLTQGKDVEAEKLLRDFLNEQNKAPNSATTLAALLLSQKRLPHTQQILDRLHNHGVNNIQTAAMQARVYLLNAEPERAITLLMKHAPTLHQHPAHYVLLAQSAQRAKRFTLAEKTYRSLIEIDSKRGDWWVGLGVSLDAQGQTTQALNAYQKALNSTVVTQALKAYAQQRLSTQRRSG
ncbi:MAG: hypothetical protein JKY66_05810 [Spongiibacteraceae bacterium]|nr:hypothetical protein [Spongiibacteraceae bacterium]